MLSLLGKQIIYSIIKHTKYRVNTHFYTYYVFYIVFIIYLKFILFEYIFIYYKLVIWQELQKKG